MPAQSSFSFQSSYQIKIRFRIWVTDPPVWNYFLMIKYQKCFCKYKVLIECYYYAATFHGDDIYSPLPLLHLLYLWSVIFEGLKPLFLKPETLGETLSSTQLCALHWANLSPNPAYTVERKPPWLWLEIITITPHTHSQAKSMLTVSYLLGLANIWSRKIRWRKPLISKDLKTNLLYVTPCSETKNTVLSLSHRVMSLHARPVVVLSITHPATTCSFLASSPFRCMSIIPFLSAPLSVLPNEDSPSCSPSQC